MAHLVPLNLDKMFLTVILIIFVLNQQKQRKLHIFELEFRKSLDYQLAQFFHIFIVQLHNLPKSKIFFSHLLWIASSSLFTLNAIFYLLQIAEKSKLLLQCGTLFLPPPYSFALSNSQFCQSSFACLQCWTAGSISLHQLFGFLFWSS